MSFFNKLFNFSDTDDYEDEMEGEEEEIITRRDPARRRGASSRAAQPELRSAREPYAAAPRSQDNNKVVNIHTTAQVQVVVIRAEKFENASEIADHLRDKRTVVLNLESTDKTVARRLIDFLSGVAYANDGNIKKVANSTYIITPYNVQIMDNLIDELESNGLYL